MNFLIKKLFLALIFNSSLFALLVIGIQNRPKDNYDFFSQEYNDERHNLLQKIDGVINLGTTFGVDASIAKLPVMQIDLTESNISEFKYLK